MPVGDVRLLRHLLGRADPEAEAAFAAGKAVVFDPALLRNGSTDLVLTSYGEAGEEERRVVPVPAVAARPQTRTVQAVLPRAAVERAGYEVTLEALIVDPGEHRITPGEEEAIAGDLSRVYYSLSIYVERGPQSGVAPQLLALAVAVALVVLGATFTATGLAAADARHDLAVMHAVGATARTRRAFVAGQAAIISGAGVLLGLLAGLVPGVAAAWRLTARFGTAWGWPLSPEPVTPTIEVPWALLGGGAVGLPLLAMLVAAAFARGRIALPRRIA
ncbi:FtsX-like permease family protein [Thermocatellispora tengchongensis]|uniref:FtsX-like permease family protein n=1 Tax=Thermocatellispora tengchongensis TaxID=1073253 RepID=UPI0036370807